MIGVTLENQNLSLEIDNWIVPEGRLSVDRRPSMLCVLFAETRLIMIGGQAKAVITIGPMKIVYPFSKIWKVSAKERTAIVEVTDL